MASTILFGISNCDQVRKARKWLQGHDVPFIFHDFRRDGLDSDTLVGWMKHLPWDALLNKRGRTWRDLDEASRRSIVDEISAREIMLAEPTLIKRPVLVHNEDVLVGFSSEAYERTLSLGNDHD